MRYSENPDNWVVLEISNPRCYKVLIGYSGGYLDADSWRLNSGIVKVEEDGDYYNFYGHSGSIYHCHKESYGLRMNNAGIYNRLKDKYPDDIDLMPEDTNWRELDFSLP